MIEKLKGYANYALTGIVFVLSFAVYMLLGRVRRAETEMDIQKGEKEISDAKQELGNAHSGANDAQSNYERIRDKYRSEN
jgi:cell division protein FtsL